MNNPMNLINLKMATAVAAVLTVVASFAPQAAHAALWRSGAKSIVGNGNLDFTLNTSDMDSNPDPNIGQYTAGIENLNVTFESRYNNVSGGFAQASVPFVPLNAFRVEPSELQPNSDNEILISTRTTDWNIDLGPFIRPSQLVCPGPACVDKDIYNNGLVVYEAKFEVVDNTGTLTSNKLAFFLPSLGDPLLDSEQLVNSLSGLDREFNNISQVQGVLSSTASSGEELRRFGIDPLYPYISLERVEAVPEPADTAGLLAFGAMGAILLLRRNRGIQR